MTDLELLKELKNLSILKIRTIDSPCWLELIENINKNSTILSGIENGTDFYFVHSYYLDTNTDNKAADTNYEVDFCSVVEKDNIFGTQFHPEKSAKSGRKILENFANF